MPAANSAAVPISMAVAPLRLPPWTVTSPPPPAAPLAGVTLVTLGAAGSGPAGALVDMAGLASAEEATALLLDWTRAGVTLPEFTTPFTVTVPLVNGLLLCGARNLLPGRGPAHPSGARGADGQDAGRKSLGHGHRGVLRGA